LQFIFAILSTSNFLDSDNCYCYDVYKLIYYLIDSWNQYRECTILFYLVEYIDFDFILDMSILVKQDILIDSKTKNWQFKIANNKLKIINFKQFVLDLVKYSTVYTIVCADVTKTLNKKSIESKILKKLKNLKNICNNKLTRILLELRKKNYVIEF